MKSTDENPVQNLMKEEKKNDRIGIAKFFAWKSRAVSSALNFIILGYFMIYATSILNIPVVLVSSTIMASRITNTVTDLFFGLLIDRTKTRLGKARPYELAIIGLWVTTWLLFSIPTGWGQTQQIIYIFILFFLNQVIFNTLLQVNANVYLLRAFPTKGQKIRLASFGGVVTMVFAIAFNITFPLILSGIDLTHASWSRLILLFSVPLMLIGLLRFIFVKETVFIEENQEKAKLKDMIVLLKKNSYFLKIATLTFGFSLVTGMGISPFFFTYVTGDIANVGIANMIGIITVPLLFIFPKILKKFPLGKVIALGSVSISLSGLIYFLANDNMAFILIGVFFFSLGQLPLTSFSGLLALDVGTYNSILGNKRMDGTISSLIGFVSRIGSALGIYLVGVFLSLSGFDSQLSAQPPSAILTLRLLMGGVPAVFFALIALQFFFFYKLDYILKKKES